MVLPIKRKLLLKVEKAHREAAGKGPRQGKAGVQGAKLGGLRLNPKFNMFL